MIGELVDIHRFDEDGLEVGGGIASDVHMAVVGDNVSVAFRRIGSEMAESMNHASDETFLHIDCVIRVCGKKMMEFFLFFVDSGSNMVIGDFDGKV